MKSPRKVLMIAAAFPPTGGPGVQRTARFAKYLPRCGWTPIVWTLEAMLGLPRDDSLARDLPKHVVVHRSRLPGVTHAASATARIADWFAPAALPDECAAWARKSVEPLCHMVAHEDVSAIYSTYSPASNHLLAMRVQQRTGLPWIADFRDPWTDDFRYEEASAFRRDAHRRLEQQILETADAVIGVSEGQTALLARHVPGRRDRFHTITNGFDPEDFADTNLHCRIERGGARDVFTLAHVGRLDRRRGGAALNNGISTFIAATAPEQRFRLRVVGHCAATTRKALRAFNIDCDFVEYVDHAGAIRNMCDADALLLCVGEGPNAATAIPAKLFEYLAARRPILAVGDPCGDAAHIVENCNAGITCAADGNAIAAALQLLHRQWSRGTPLPGCSAERAEPFSRVRLTERLAEILDSLTDVRPESGESVPSKPQIAEACGA